MTLHLWSRGVCGLLGIRREVVGVPQRGPSLHVGNHRGYLDVVVLSAASPSLFVSRDDLAGWPILGYLGGSVGTIFLDRTRPRAVAEASERMAALFAANLSVILFPEGTTTDGGADGCELAPFHSSLFEPALRAGVPVQAVALDYLQGRSLATWTGRTTFLPHFWKLLCARGVNVRARFADPVHGQTDRRAAAQAARTWIAETLLRERQRRDEPAPHGLRDAT